MLAPLVSAQGFEAGAAQSVITPQLLPPHALYLAGFGHNRLATAVHDDLYARCLAIGIAPQTLVICSADLIGLFYDDVLAIRRAFQQKTPSASFLIVLPLTPTPHPTRWGSTVPPRSKPESTSNTWTGSTSASPQPPPTPCAPCSRRGSSWRATIIRCLLCCKVLIAHPS